LKKEITVKPIGIIHTPYKGPKGIPIQGKFDKEVLATAELFFEYRDGLKDVEAFSHVYLIYYFDKATEENLLGKPFLEEAKHGIFAIRSPNRPNRLGISVVKVEKVEDCILTFSEVDILDGTPLLDIKPYVSHFDLRENVKNGWIEKHFKNGEIPESTILD